MVGGAGPQVLDVEQAAGVGDAALDLLFGQAHLARPEGHFLFHARAEELGVAVLEDEAHALMQAFGEGLVFHRFGRHGRAVEEVGALLGKDEPVHRLQEGRFARPVVAHEHDRISRVDFQIDVAQNRLVFVGVAEVAEFDERMRALVARAMQAGGVGCGVVIAHVGHVAPGEQRIAFVHVRARGVLVGMDETHWTAPCRKANRTTAAASAANQAISAARQGRAGGVG